MPKIQGLCAGLCAALPWVIFVLVACNRNWLWLTQGKEGSGAGILEEHLVISQNPSLRKDNDQETSDFRSGVHVCLPWRKERLTT